MQHNPVIIKVFLFWCGVIIENLLPNVLFSHPGIVLKDVLDIYTLEKLSLISVSTDLHIPETVVKK